MTRTPLTTSLDVYEVWFLTGSQHLYGPQNNNNRDMIDQPTPEET